MALFKDQFGREQSGAESALKAPEKVATLAAIGEPSARPAAAQTRADASTKESIIAAGLTIEARSKARVMSASPETSRAMSMFRVT